MEQWPSRWEWVAVVALLLALQGLDLASYNLYPAVWCDEVLYSEPAINLVRHGSYTTAAYEFQPPNTFPIVNCPLYGMTLVPWLAATGTSLLAVRSYNYALMALACFLVWNVSWRFSLVRSTPLRLLMIALLHLGYGMSFSYRSCRPDILGMVCLLLLLLCFRIWRPRVRGLCLFGLAAAASWIGFQVALFACFACFASWIVFRRRAAEDNSTVAQAQPAQSKAVSPGWREVLLVSLGVAFGAGTLILFLSWKGMLAWFIPPVLGVVKGTYYVHSAGHPVSNYLRRVVSAYGADFSTVALMPLLLVLAIGLRRRLSGTGAKVALYGLVLLFGAPALFEAVGHFAFYYSYLQYTPAVVVLFALVSDLRGRETAPARRWLKPAFALTLATAVVVGLPLRLALAASCSRQLTRSEFQRILASRISPTDTVFSEYLPFFEVKQIAPVVYHFYSSVLFYHTGVPGRDMTPEEKRAVSALVIRPEQKDRICAFFGGAWEPVGDPFGDTQDFRRVTHWPIIGRRLASYAAQPQTERFQVQVFRRMNSP